MWLSRHRTQHTEEFPPVFTVLPVNDLKDANTPFQVFHAPTGHFLSSSFIPGKMWTPSPVHCEEPCSPTPPTPRRSLPACKHSEGSVRKNRSNRTGGRDDFWFVSGASCLVYIEVPQDMESYGAPQALTGA